MTEVAISFDTDNMKLFIQDLLSLNTNTVLKHVSIRDTRKQVLLIHFSGDRKELRHKIYSWLVQHISIEGE
jgi:hypothetical protein